MMAGLARLGAGVLLACGAAALPVAPAYAGPCIQVPAPSCPVTSTFGPRFNPITKNYSTEFHHGVDFGCPPFTRIIAADAGLVDVSALSTTAGNWVRAQRAGVVYKYMHNERNLAKMGSMVSQGEEIALSGNTGRSTGPHLHFQVEVNGKAADPMPMFCSKPNMKPGLLDGGLPAQSDVTSALEQAAAPSNNGVPPIGLDGSLQEILSDAIGTRALNPDYLRQLQSLPEVGLYRELAYERTLRLKTKHEIQRSVERRMATNAMLNALLADKILLPQIEAQRAAATASVR